MGELATPTEAERKETRELAARIVESVRADEPMPLPEDVEDAIGVSLDERMTAAVKDLYFRFAQEIDLLKDERDEAWRIVRSAAHMAKAYIELSDNLADEEEVQSDLGQAQVWIDQANERVPRPGIESPKDTNDR